MIYILPVPGKSSLIFVAVVVATVSMVVLFISCNVIVNNDPPMTVKEISITISIIFLAVNLKNKC